MAGNDNILNLFITANIESLKSGMADAASSFKASVDAMKASGATLPADIETAVAQAAASFISLNPVLQAQATAVLDLKAAYSAAKADIAETEAIIAEAGGTTEVASSILRKYTEETAQVIVLQRALKDATKEYDATLRDLLNVQIEASQAEKANATAVRESTQAAGFAVITDEARARVKAELARLDALDATGTTAAAAATNTAARTTVASTEATAVAANTASEAYLRLARATIANAQAQSEVRTFASQAAEAIGLESQFTNDLALAQERAAATSLELAAAQSALEGAEDVATVATVRAAEAQNLFRGRLAVSEYGIRGFLSSSVTSLPVLAGLFAATFAVSAVEAIQKAELALADLSVMTGLTIRDLYDTGKAAEAFGAKSDDLTSVMRRLSKTVSDAASGNKSAQLTLRELGVDMSSISLGIVPPLNTVMAQMADYLRLNAGNAEVMRAAMRALGSDSAALGAFLSQGSQKVREQSEAFAATGTAMQLSEGEARKLAQTQAELSATYDRIKLSLLPVLNQFVSFETMLARLTGVADAFTAALKGMDEVAKLLRGDFSDLKPPAFLEAGGTIPTDVGKSLSDVLGPIKAFAPPKPPVLAEQPEKKPKAPPVEKSDLPEFRAELEQREAAFEGSRAAMLAMELSFWEQLISTGRVKARDLIAVHAEISRTEIQLQREVVREAESAQRDIVSVTRAGSDARVQESQRLMELERTLRTADSSEFKKAQAEYLIAVRDRVEETIRLNLRAIDENIAMESRGSFARVALYDTQLKMLQSSLTTAQLAVKREQDAVTATGSDQSRLLMRIAEGEANFDIEQIQRVTKERNIAQREAIAEQEKQAADARRLRVTESLGTARQTIGEDDVAARAKIQQIEQDGLLTLRQKDNLIRQVIEIQRAQIDDALRGAEAEAAANIALSKTVEQRIAAERLLMEIQKLRAAENKRLLAEEAAESNRVSKQEEQNALRVGAVIGNSFKSAFDTMLTTHTTFANVMTKFWNDMVLGFARMGLQILADWIKMIAARVVAWVVGEQVQTAAATSGAAARTGIGIAETLKSIGRAAATAAAHAFKWVMEEVPFPANVVLAPAVAAASFAAVLGFGALASAAQGGVLDKDTLVQAHAKEMILPASISTGLQGIIAGGGAEASGSAVSNSTVNGGSRTMHNHMRVEVNNNGGKEIDHDKIVDSVRRGIRAGSLRLLESL